MEIERLHKEVDIIKKTYPDAVCDGELRYVIISRFPLPSGWNMEKTELMIEIPGGYPAVAPDNFYVTEGLRLKDDGNPPEGYDEGIEKFGKKWGRFSWHLDGKWQPHTEISRGDNLFSFVLSAERRLKKLE